MLFVRSLTLKSICLNVIYENIERIMHNDLIPQWKIDYLHRFHSQEMFEKLKEDSGISEAYMLWFLNPHSKYIQLSFISDNIIKRLQTIGSNISFLNMKYSLASETILNSIMCCIPNVVDMCLAGTDCSNKTLHCMQIMCPKLVSLDLSECPKINDDGMEPLSHSKFLKNLNLLRTPVSHKGLSLILENLKLIQCLKHRFLPHLVHYSAMQGIGHDKYNLTELVCDSKLEENFEDVLQTWKVCCPNVSTLKVTSKLTLKTLDICSDFQNLVKLNLVNTEDLPTVDDVARFFSQKCPFLTTLELAFVNVSISSLLVCCKRLSHLYLCRMRFVPFEERSLSCEDNNLSTLTIRNVSLEDPLFHRSILLLIASCRNLHSLVLNYVFGVTREITDLILQCCGRLVAIDFSFTLVQASQVVRFLSHPCLRNIWFDACFDCPSEDFRAVITCNHKSTLAWRLSYTDSKYVGHLHRLSEISVL